MLKFDEQLNRDLREATLDVDLVVVGGGIAGTCAAITASRQGLRVALVQDRPVLGGNASSEIRLWMVGATSHMGNNNRWAREGGVLNEILMENAYRNPEGNPVIFDTVLLEKVVAEPSLTLLLNTAVYEIAKNDDNSIQSVTGFCSQNSTRYLLNAPLFCDASGDGIVGFLAGAAFRIGVESHTEFGELLAPSEENCELLGHSIYFYTRDVGRPVEYVAPEFALRDIDKIPRYRRFNTKEQGTDLWWIEYGGSKDTIHDTEKIKWELWKIIYGVWDYIKNSGKFPDADTLTLDWVGLIPGKRESRRFEGDYMLIQQDIVEQRHHDDAVSFGGWAIDQHPVDNIYSKLEPCTQWHSKGVYQIPYRTMYSRNVPNLFLTGRIISASHVAFASSRVMATCGHNGQAVGVAAALCHEMNLQPRDLVQATRMSELQLRLLRSGQHIPNTKRADIKDLAQQATITASSSLQKLELNSVSARQLDNSCAILLPLAKQRGNLTCKVRVRYHQATELNAELRTCSRKGSFTPDVVIDRAVIPLHLEPKIIAWNANSTVTEKCAEQKAVGLHSAETSTATNTSVSAKPVGQASLDGGSGSKRPNNSDMRDVELELRFNAEIEEDTYVFVCFLANPLVEIYESQQLVTGITTVINQQNSKVSSGKGQIPPPGSGIDAFELWPAERRPRGRNLSVSVDLDAAVFSPKNVANGHARPTCRPNAWVASPEDPLPTLTFRWPEPQQVKRVELVFDPDWDHPMENIVMQHHERVMPTIVRSFRVLGPDRTVLASCRENHSAMVSIDFKSALTLDKLFIELDHPTKHVPASLYELRCYPDAERSLL